MRKFRSILTWQVLLLTLLLGFVSCKQGPREEDPTPVKARSAGAGSQDNVVMDLHKVTVKETIPGEKYLYMKIAEGDREYWAATGKSDVSAGETYYYNEALVQTGFKSKELERVFDTLYLITQLVPESHGAGMKPLEKAGEPPAQAFESNIKKGFHSSPLAGKAIRLSIAELLKDPEAYKDKVVEITATCTKINEGILGRNWLHLQDGTADDQDLVVTSQDAIDPGNEVTIRAIVQLDRDFGAGYAYDVLLEEGRIIR